MNEPRSVMAFIEADRDGALAIAERVARRYGLPLSGGDLLGEVVVKILQRGSARHRTVENPAAYFTRSCQHVCNTLLRRREPGIVDDWDELDEGAVEAPDPGSDPASGAASLQLPDRFRAAVEHLATDLRAAAGVLAWLVLASDPHIPVDDLPRPLRGVAADRQLDWPALWLATRERALFSDGAAVSRRRQRLLNRIDAQRTLVTDHLRARHG